MSTKEAFALLLESACDAFEALLSLLQRKVTIGGSSDHLTSGRAAAAIRMALAQSFVFNTCRAHRLCKHQAGALGLDRDERKVFIAATETLVDVRDINEHAYERKVSSAGRKQKSRMMHDQGNSFGDETSLTIDQGGVLMGPLDLRDVYRAVDRMRSLAGFRMLGDGD
ncbi:hypothetical protein CQ12_13820 [Bradyrhizobium jicamae]|uniref:HEPN AbiU2-like domain-containing protein n=1 Tax=Bradyrhizobium jicamae TaxID=280332 RepID=A0A0R3LP01_9BRAD|nr:hypothetical protein CQ12_13820 [Bradyrhizobium jicamae]